MAIRPIVLAVLAATAPAWGLTPDQIVIVERRDAISGQVARHYCEQRGVPKENRLALDLPAGDVIAWSTYQGSIVKPVRQFIEKKKQVQSIRCLLLIGNFPLRIEPDPGKPIDKQEIAEGEEFCRKAAVQIYQAGALAHNLAHEGATEQVPGKIGNTWEAENYYFEKMGDAWRSIGSQPADRRKQVTDRLMKIRVEMEGCFAQADPEPRNYDPPEDFRKDRAEWDKQVAAKVQPMLDKKLVLGKKLTEAEALRLTESDKRRDRRKAVQEARGLLGMIRQFYDDRAEMTGDWRFSSLDSELALLWRDNYKLNDRQRNGLLGRGAALDDEKQPTVMVARLDWFDQAHLTRLIDDAITVEKAGQGIVGKLCLDAQGLDSKDPRSWQDRLVLDVENVKGRPATMPLAKEATMGLLAATDANPVAFYAGWCPGAAFPAGYKCVCGAVTVSAADFAAAELHDAKSRQWCNAWLSAGAAAVIGGIDKAEPRDMVDLPAFAKALLVDGQTLADAYWSTCYSTSWRAILVGDPLYRPAAKKPVDEPEKPNTN